MNNIVTIAIVIGTSIMSYLAFNDRNLFEKYMFNPYLIRKYKQHYRFLSHAFIHADWFHLVMNMYVLYSFGSMLEKGFFVEEEIFGKYGKLMYILLYTGGIYASSVVDYFRHKDNSSYSSIGASGAVSAVLFSYILLDPMGKIGYFFLPGIPAFIFAILYLVYSFYMDKRNADNIGHGAHAWGAIFGFVFTGLMYLPLFERFIHKIIP